MSVKVRYRFSLLIAGLLILASLVLANEAATAPKTGEFPPPLLAAEFKAEMAKGLHVVEFFSPYCSHCKKLAPAWKQAWETMHADFKDLPITFSQVDCVISGDLCGDESIEYYPTIRLYGPDGAIKNYPEDSDRSVQSLLDFAKKEVMDLANIPEEDLVSKSVPLTDDDVVRLLAGKGDAPYLISFWPTRSMLNTDKQSEFVDCAECTPFQRIWRSLSNKLPRNNIRTGHINCVQSTVLCKELGFKNLVDADNDSNDREPRVALILPGKISNNLFLYPKNRFSSDAAVYEDFAVRITHNNEAPYIAPSSLLKIMSENIDAKGLSSRDVTDQKIHVVFSYDPKTAFQEDFDVLEHLIEPLQEISNVYLYKTNESLVDITKIGYDNMYTMIENYDKDHTPIELNQNNLVLNTMTQLPTFFLFRDGDTLPQVFPGYSSTETRDTNMILSWISSFANPLYSELTPYSLHDLMDVDEEFYKSIVVMALDSTDKDFKRRSQDILRRVKIAGYEYEHERMEQKYDDIVAGRKDKKEFIQKLKDRRAPSNEVEDAMVIEVPHKNNLKLILAYYDISKFDRSLSWVKENFLSKPLKTGDVIVIDKDDGRVFQYDSSNHPLTVHSPTALKDALLSINLPSKTSYDVPSAVLLGKKWTQKTKSSRSSPVNMLFMAVVFICVVLTLKSKSLKKHYRTRMIYNNKRDTNGILGKEKFQD